VKINAAVGMGRSHDVHFNMEVFEWLLVADVEQVAAIAMGDQSAILDFPCAGVLFRFFPAIESLAIEKLDEAFLGIGGEEQLRGRKDGGGSEGEKQISFHVAENKEDEKLAQENLEF
jgi:hypothetical protein